MTHLTPVAAALIALLVRPQLKWLTSRKRRLKENSRCASLKFQARLAIHKRREKREKQRKKPKISSFWHRNSNPKRMHKLMLRPPITI